MYLILYAMIQVLGISLGCYINEPNYSNNMLYRHGSKIFYCKCCYIDDFKISLGKALQTKSPNLCYTGNLIGIMLQFVHYALALLLNHALLLNAAKAIMQDIRCQGLV